jgi:methylmalonyl-CoA mutase cobalamin-binding subunit
MTMILAKQMIDVLRQAGVERVYGVVGDSLNPVAGTDLGGHDLRRDFEVERRP